MENGDVIRHTMIMEVDGVAISNSFYYVIKDNTLATTLTALITAVHADWWDRIDNTMSSDSATTCSIWDNLNGNDPTITVFQTFVGAVLVNNLPAQLAVAVAKKAVRSDGRIINSVNKFSGIAESLQNGGHLLDYEIALGLETWLTADVANGPTVFRNVIRSPLGPMVEVLEIELATTRPHIVTVPSRQPVLCRSPS